MKQENKIKTHLPPSTSATPVMETSNARCFAPKSVRGPSTRMTSTKWMVDILKQELC